MYGGEYKPMETWDNFCIISSPDASICIISMSLHNREYTIFITLIHVSKQRIHETSLDYNSV